MQNSNALPRLLNQSFSFGLTAVVFFAGNFTRSQQIVAKVGGGITVFFGDVGTLDERLVERGENDFYIAPESDFLGKITLSQKSIELTTKKTSALVNEFNRLKGIVPSTSESANTLANRIPINSRNDANYYVVELAELPEIEADEKDCQIYLTKVEGDVANNNYISSLKKIK